MIPDKKTCFARCLLKSFIPFLTGATCYFLKEILLIPGSRPNIHNILNSPEAQSNLIGIIVDLLSYISHISFGIYANYFAFLFVMMLIDTIPQNLKQKGWTRAFATISLDQKNVESELDKKISEQRVRIFMRILCYSLIFMILQVAGFSMNFYYGKDIKSILKTQYQDQEDNFNNMIPARVLEEEIIPKLQSSSEKISLLMGNVIGSADIEVTSMVLSRDRRVAFATLEFYGTLKIIDLSDPQNPLILGSLDLNVSGDYFRLKTLILSPDEKTLYISNSEYLEIVDVNDLKSPKRMSSTISTIFNKTIGDKVSDYFKTSLVLDEKTKTLYIGGLGLQVYDVSDMRNPVLLKAYKNELQYRTVLIYGDQEMLLWNDICLSHDGKVLLMASGSLEVYDISNPRDIKLIQSFPVGSDVRSIYLSEEDPGIAFLLGDSKNSQELILEKVNISDYSSPPKVLGSYSVEWHGGYGSRILTTSPGGTKVFIFHDDLNEDFSLTVLDTIRKKEVLNEGKLIGKTYTMSFSHDGRTLITGSNDELLVIEMFLDYPNSQIFGSEPTISTLDLEHPRTDLTMSSDGRFLFMKRSIDGPLGRHFKVFEIWDVNNPGEALGSYEFDEVISQMSFASDYNTVYLGIENSISVLDISNKTSPILKKTFDFETEKDILQILTTSDGNLSFILLRDEKTTEVVFVSLLESEEKKSLLIFDKRCERGTCKLILKDDQTLMMLDNEITVFNISILEAPLKKVASLALSQNEPGPIYVQSCVLTPDKNTLYVEVVSWNGFSKLAVYDVSLEKSPRFVGERVLSKLDSPLQGRLPFSLSADVKTGFVSEEKSLITVNLTDLRISGIIRLAKPGSSTIVSYVLSSDGQTMYIAFEFTKFMIMNMNVKHTLFLKKEKFLLGERYSDTVEMLEFKSGEYQLMKPNAYKIIKLSLIDIKMLRNKAFTQITTSLLPLWINFDEQRNLVNIEPLKQLGLYDFQAAVSLKIPENIFDKVFVEVEEKPISSEELLIFLMNLGYIDTEMFLTDKFGSFETFRVPPQLNGIRSIKQDIYNLLKGYHIETCTGFEIIPSLGVEMGMESMMISTLSLNNIKVEISLLGEEKAKFVNKPYGLLLPVINEFKNKLTLEGTSKEINAALESIVIDFPTLNSKKTNAMIIINDGLNPLAIKNLTSQEVEKYFKKNKSPKENNKVQEQINRVNIETGQYFTLTFAEDTFIDAYSPNSSLTYDFAMPQQNKERLKWINLNKLTLTGTPPEEVFGREIDLILVAKNEFKENRVPFRINIKISSNFALKLVWRYCPYILSIIGLLVSINKIYNILGKRFYKHPKEYILRGEEEINSGVIFPIYFIKQEKYESEIIFKHLMKNSDKSGLEKHQIIEAIEEIVREKISNKERTKLKYYCSSLNYRKLLIQQLVIDKLNFLKLNREKETKKIFDKIKDKWVDMIYWDSGESKFALNQLKFEKIILEGIIKKKALEEEHLLDGTSSNLLKDCVIAYTFGHHQINQYPAKAKVEMRQRVEPNFLYRFIKRDLRSISVGIRNRLNFGISCEINQNMLIFSGVTAKEVENETLVLQIWNSRQRILKEIWFYGRHHSSKLADNVNDTFDSESMKKGHDYEVY